MDTDQAVAVRNSGQELDAYDSLPMILLTTNLFISTSFFTLYIITNQELQ